MPALKNRVLAAVTAFALVVGLCPMVAFGEGVPAAEKAEPASASAENPAAAEAQGDISAEGAIQGQAAVAEADAVANEGATAVEGTVEGTVEGAAGGEQALPAQGEKATDETADDDLEAASNRYSGLQFYNNVASMNSRILYTGSELHPDLQLICDGKALTEGEDYEITAFLSEGEPIATLVDMGSYTAEVKAIGGSAFGQASIPFSVVGNFSTATINGPSFTLSPTGNPAFPEITVTLDGQELEMDVDYVIDSILMNGMHEVQLSEAIDPAYYQVTLKGVESRGYYGFITFGYSIDMHPTENDLSATTLSNWYTVPANRWAPGSITPIFEYTGQPVNPKPTLVTSDGKTLVEGKDYEISYRKTESYVEVENCIDEGRYSIQFTGIGDYIGGNGAIFAISKPEHDLTQAEITGLDQIYYYTGSSIDANPKLVLNGVELNSEPLVYNNLGWSNPFGVKDIIYPGHYLLVYTAVAGDSNYYGVQLADLYVIEPPTDEALAAAEPVTDQTTGIALTGTLFSDLSVNGGEVQLTTANLEQSDPDRFATLASTYKDENTAFFAAFDVNLNLADAATGATVALTENLGRLNLSLPVDSAYNGFTATVTQLHENADGTAAVTAAQATVENGQVTVPINRLSVFVVTINKETTPAGNGGTTPDTTPAAGTTVNNPDNGATKAAPETATIAEKSSKTPATGDSLVLPAVLVLVGAIACAGVVVASRRMRAHK